MFGVRKQRLIVDASEVGELSRDVVEGVVQYLKSALREQEAGPVSAGPGLTRRATRRSAAGRAVRATG
jgi:hypothetical protein